MLHYVSNGDGLLPSLNPSPRTPNRRVEKLTLGALCPADRAATQQDYGLPMEILSKETNFRWSTTAGQPGGRTPRGLEPPPPPGPPLRPTPRRSRSGNELLSWVEKELEARGLLDSPPCPARLEVFSQALLEVVNIFPSYRGVLFAVKSEHDAVVKSLRAAVDAANAVEGRMQVIKAESVSLVGQSTAHFQHVTSAAAARLEELEKLTKEQASAVTKLSAERAEYLDRCLKSEEKAEEMHKHNMVIVRNYHATHEEVQALRKQVHLLEADNKRLHQQKADAEAMVKDKDDKLQEAEKFAKTMVTRKEYNDLHQKLVDQRKLTDDYAERLRLKERDYLKLVSDYNRISGASVDTTTIRPLTPRPQWRDCYGVVEPEAPSLASAAIAQDVLCSVLEQGRTILNQYGLHAALQKCSLASEYGAKQLFPSKWVQDARDDSPPRGQPEANDHSGAGEDGPLPSSETAPPQAASVSATKFFASGSKYSHEFFEIDVSESTPEELRHGRRLRNPKLSKQKILHVLSGMLAKRLKRQETKLPFRQYFLSRCRLDAVDRLFDPVGTPEQQQDQLIAWGICILAGIRHYASEPDFLAFLLLFEGRITDFVVRENQTMIQSLIGYIEAVHPGEDIITKQVFFYNLQKGVRNKDKKDYRGNLSQLQQMLPTGKPEILVDYRNLLVDDLYLPSPLAYTLRLQHLQEQVEWSLKLKSAIRAEASEAGTISYEQIINVLTTAIFASVDDEDMARGFGVPGKDLRMESEVEVESFLLRLQDANICSAINAVELEEEDL
mmetsp:Transcript_67309/g.179530  ORF Transcript_67309/g.179530 Transcript_67309/m.179530 type:complete len:782 (-) Transcript_67309:204-2549(-)